MKKINPIIHGVLFFVLFFGCESDTVVSPEVSDSTVLNEPFHIDNAVAISSVDVITFEDPEKVVGTSALTRNNNGVSFRLNTTELESGTAATLWFVVFNKPENCDGPCGEDDLFTTSVMTDVMYAGGRVIRESGKANFAGAHRVGDNSGSIFPAFGLPSPGLMDARKAEIHFVVRSHGEIIPKLIHEMISTFAGGCDGFPPELGAPGPNTCLDVQFSVHK